MIILKFGGTSVSTSERIESICSIVDREQGEHPIIVVSAVRGVTDLLLSLHSMTLAKQKAALKELARIHMDLAVLCFGDAPKDIEEYINESVHSIVSLLKKEKITNALQDEIVAFGEKLSSSIITHAINRSGGRAEQVSATQVIATDDNFTNADFLPTATKLRVKKILLPLIKKGITPVVTGFIGSTLSGRTTTLGRGGSDYSAAIIGYTLGVSEIQIWTDVDGIYTSDPRVVPTAALLKEITYREASELAAFGAKVLHPRTIRPAISAGIAVRVMNTLNTKSEGTRIIAVKQKENRVSAIASRKSVKLVNLYSTEMLLSKGFLVRIFNVFAVHSISVDLVSVSEVSVSVTLDNTDNLKKAIEELSAFTSVTTRDVGIVSLVGEGIAGVPHVMKNIFSVLDTARIPVHMVSLGASEINISLVTDTEAVDATVRLLHDNILLSELHPERSFV